MNKADIYQPEVLRDFHAGREHAFDAIFSHFFPTLTLFANRIIHEVPAGQDIAQDALIKAWEKRSDFENIGKLKSFLYTCVRNSCLKEIDKQKVQQKYRDSLHDYDLDDSDMLRHMIHSEVVSRIFSQVDTLPEQCRKVIRMTFDEGKKPSEIAEELGISISTVNSQKMRGITLLRKKLSNRDLLTAIALIMPGFTLHS